MAKRLRCWKTFPAIRAIGQKGKQVNVSYVNKDENKVLHINEFLIGSAFPDSRKFTGETEWVVHGEGVYRNFGLRNKALSFAEEYMEEHDTCRRDIIDPYIERGKETLDLIGERRGAEKSFSKEFIK